MLIELGVPGGLFEAASRYALVLRATGQLLRSRSDRIPGPIRGVVRKLSNELPVVEGRRWRLHATSNDWELAIRPTGQPRGLRAERRDGADRSVGRVGSLVRRLVAGASKRLELIAPLSFNVPARTPTRALRVGLTFNAKSGSKHDSEAEFDSYQTIHALASTIESLGHTVILLEADATLLHRLPAASPDVVFNVAECWNRRGREAYVPAICELLDIPFTGSDVTTYAICLDKDLTKRILRQAGIETPTWQLLTTGSEAIRAFRYPVIVKPNHDGSSKGISAASVVGDEASAREHARLLIETYRQPAIVEEYIAGRELTVGLLGNNPTRTLPAKEIVFLDDRALNVYGYADKQEETTRVRSVCPAPLTASEADRVRGVCLETFTQLGCRDVARIDLRLGLDGRVHVIEVNPLPGLDPGFSDLCIAARASGIEYRSLVGAILESCLARTSGVDSARINASEVPRRDLDAP